MKTFNEATPNGTAEDIKLGFLHSVDGYYVTNEGTKSNPNFHVWVPDLTCSICDSAYAEISLAVCRCNYLAEHKILFNRLYFPTTSKSKLCVPELYNQPRKNKNVPSKNI